MNRQFMMKVLISMVVIALFILWFSDILPVKVAEVVATIYIGNQDDSEGFILIDSDYSSAHDSYIVYFSNEETGEQRNIGVYYRFFPFVVYYDSFFPG